MWLCHRVMSPNDADGAVWSGSALFAQAELSENLGSLRYVHRPWADAILFAGPEVDINARCKEEDINIDWGPQPKLNKNPWLNVIITHSKFIHTLHLFLIQSQAYFLTIFRIFSQSFSLLYSDEYSYISYWKEHAGACQSCRLARFLKSTGKYVRFFAVYTRYLCTWSVKARWTVRAKTLDQRWFNIPECPAHAHFYTAEFRFNYAWVCNKRFY